MTVLIYVENEIKEACECIESIRTNIGDSPINVILIDNHSNDGLFDWASLQDDFTYVNLDEKRENYGTAINMVVRELNITDDLIILPATTRVKAGFFQTIENYVNNNSKANLISFAEIEENTQSASDVSCRAMVLADKGFFIKGNFFKEHPFSEKYCMRRAALVDYSLSNVFSEETIYEIFVPMIGTMDSRYMTDTDISELENKWHTHYFNVAPNRNIVRIVQNLNLSNPNILEIGCDLGATLYNIKNVVSGASIYGTDLNPASVKIASFYLDDVKVDNIEDYKLRFGDIKFDVIIFGDVLEHLRNPEGALEYCKSLLNPGGYIVASIPNFMHISVIQDLLNGNFTYREVGLLDKTHIHMFTFNEIVRMFVENLGFEITYLNYTQMPVNDEQRKLMEILLSLSKTTKQHMYEAFQYIVIAKYNG